MTSLYIGLAAFLLLTLVLGAFRILTGPTRADRMVALMLFGTTGVAVLLLTGSALKLTAYADVALVFALLAAVGAVAFVGRVQPSAQEGENEPD